MDPLYGACAWCVVITFSRLDINRVSTRSIPTLLPHATANQKKEEQCSTCARCRVEDAKERIKATVDNQKSFADRFSHSPSETRLDGTDGARIPVRSRWASRFERSPRISRGSPMVGRWSARTPGKQPMAVRSSLARMGCDPHVRMPLGSKRLLAPVEGERDGGKGEGSKRLAMTVDGYLDRNGVGGEVGEEERRNEGNEGGPKDPEGGEGGREGDPRGTDTGKRGETQGKGRETTEEASQQMNHSGGRKYTGGLVKGPWTKEEDEKIIRCIMQKITKWSEVAEHVEGRVGKQCRERWLNHLEPSLNRSSWTAAEDGILVQGQARFGNSWTTISKLLPGRSENAVKNRWHSAIRKKGRKFGWGSSTETSRMSSSTTSLITNGASPSEFVKSQKVPILPKQETGQMNNLPMIHSSHQMRPHGAVHTGWPIPSSDVQECTRPVSQGSVHLSIPQARPNREHPPDRIPPKSVESKTVPELGYGHMLTDQHPLSSSVGMPMTQRSFGMGIHSQSEATLSLPLNVPATGVLGASSAGMPMTQRPFQMSNQSQSEATSSLPLNVPATGKLGIFSIGNARPAAADTVPKRELGSASTLTQFHDDQQIYSDSKADSEFGLDDKLSLSDIFPDSPLSKASLDDSTHSFGRFCDSRRDFDEMGGASLVRQPFLEVHGGRSITTHGVMTDSEYPGGPDTISHEDRGLERCLAGVYLFNEQESQLPINDVSSRPRLDFITLLSAPTEPQAAGEFSL